MIPTVKLPSDGATYRCTFVRNGTECLKVATKGLAFVAYEVATVAAKEANLNVTFMRALCPEHIAEVSTIARYDK